MGQSGIMLDILLFWTTDMWDIILVIKAYDNKNFVAQFQPQNIHSNISLIVFLIVLGWTFRVKIKKSKCLVNKGVPTFVLCVIPHCVCFFCWLLRELSCRLFLLMKNLLGPGNITTAVTVEKYFRIQYYSISIQFIWNTASLILILWHALH